MTRLQDASDIHHIGRAGPERSTDGFDSAPPLGRGAMVVFDEPGVQPVKFVATITRRRDPGLKQQWEEPH